MLKRMKKWALGLAMLATAGVNTALAGEGGISGGGGGTTTPNGVSDVQILDTVRLSKPLLVAWLNSMDHWYKTSEIHKPEPAPALSLFFASTPNVFERISDLKIAVLMNSPCLDEAGKEVDASVTGWQDDTICVSAHRLKSKLNEFNYEFEVPALILHEVAHRLGADEALATEIQKSAIFAFRRIQPRKLIYELQMGLRYSLGKVFNALDSLSGGFNHPANLCKVAHQASNQLQEYGYDVVEIGSAVSGAPAEWRDGFRGLYIKVKAIGDVVCSRDRMVDPQMRAFLAKWYAQAFANSDRVEALEYDQMHGPTLMPVYLHSIKHERTFELELQEVRQALGLLDKQMHELGDARFEILKY